MSHEIVKPVFERSDDRGIFREILNVGSWESLVSGAMNPGSVMGNHYHKETVVFFYLLNGSAEINTIHIESGIKDKFKLNAQQGVLLKPYESHAVMFTQSSEFLMLKSIKYDPADPDTYHFAVED